MELTYTSQTCYPSPNRELQLWYRGIYGSIWSAR